MFKTRIFKEKIIKSPTNANIKQFLKFAIFTIINVNVFNLIKKYIYDIH